MTQTSCYKQVFFPLKYSLRAPTSNSYLSTRCVPLLHVKSSNVISVLVQCRVLNGRPRTGLDQLDQVQVQSSPMVEIRLTGQSWLLELTGPGSVRLGGPGKKASDKRCIRWWLIRRKIAKIAAKQKLLSHTALKKFSFTYKPLLSSTVIYHYTERSIYKAEKCSYPSIDQNTRPFFLMFTKMGYGNTAKWLNGGEDNTKDRSTMLDNQLTNGQHKSTVQVGKTTSTFFLSSSEPYPVLPSIATQFHYLPRIFPYPSAKQAC